MKLQDCDFLFVDCQTTGSGPTSGGLLELAWTCSSASRETPEIKYCLLQQPYNLIPNRITELTGISADDLEGAVSQSHASRVFKAELLKTPHCVIHYAKFEVPFLRSLLFDPLVNYGDCDEFDFTVFCTHEIVRRLYPNFPARGIKAIAGFFGQRLQPLKRASSHVHATWVIWKYLVEALAAEAVTDTEQLQAFLQQPCSHKRGKYQYPLSREKRLGLPSVPGVYRMLDRHGDILYVGKATSLKSRVNSYFRGQKKRDPQLLEMLAQVSDIEVTTCDTVIEAAVLESDEIKLRNPPYNDALKEIGRQIFFCSRDFRSKADQPDEAHVVGPFTSAWSLDRMLRLCDGAATGKFGTRIFMDYVSEELMAEGFAYFCRRWSVTPHQMTDPRNCIALGAKLSRAASRGLIELETEQVIVRSYGQLHIDSLLTGSTVIVKAEKVTLQRALDAEEVAAKVGRLLARVAQNYLRCRRLTRLLNCTIFVDGARVITMRDGMLCRMRSGDEQFGDEHTELTAHDRVERLSTAWLGKTIADYDRISVLFKELQRVKHQIGI